MTITNLPSYPHQYLSTAQYHLAPPAPAPHPHAHPHLHPAHPTHHHHHHHHQHPAYAHHPSSQHVHPQSHVLTAPVRSEPVTRKRPKYTRSKTGCLTCRVKKIKCDETKPTCTRCSHGQRECTWPENVPSRKKTVAKKQSDQASDKASAVSPDSASPSSSAPPRDISPPRKSPSATTHVSEGAVAGRKSEPGTAVGSPMPSPIDSPASATSRRPSLPHSVHSSYSPTTQPIRPQYPATLTPPSISPAPYHHARPSSHDYPPFSGQHGAEIPRHGLPSIQTSQSRLSELAVDTTTNIGHWQTAPLIPSGVEPVEPFFRTVQERSLMERPSASYASH